MKHKNRLYWRWFSWLACHQATINKMHMQNCAQLTKPISVLFKTLPCKYRCWRNGQWKHFGRVQMRILLPQLIIAKWCWLQAKWTIRTRTTRHHKPQSICMGLGCRSEILRRAQTFLLCSLVGANRCVKWERNLKCQIHSPESNDTGKGSEESSGSIA